MKVLVRKIKKWYEQSNRHIHAKWGGLEFGGFMVECILLGVDLWPAVIISYTTVVVTNLAVEGKDKQAGNMPDMLDVLASVTYPTLYIVVLAIVELILCLM